MRALNNLIICFYLISILFGGIGTVGFGDKTPLILYSDIFLLLLMFACVIKYIVTFHAVKLDNNMIMLSTLYVYAHVLSMLFNGSELINALLSLKIFFNGIGTYFVLNTFCHSKDDRLLPYCMVIFIVGLSSIIIYKFMFSPSSINLTSKDFIDIGWGKSNYLATFMAMIIPINIGLLLTSDRKYVKLSLLCSLFITILALMITMSRGAMLSVLIVLIAMLPLSFRYKQIRPYILTFGIIVVSVGIIVMIIIPEEIMTLLTKLILSRFENVDQERIYLMNAAWDDFVNNPFFGIGPFQTRTLLSRYSLMPHNFILQLLAEFGLFGTIVFFFIISTFLFRSIKSCLAKQDLLDIFILAGFLATLINGLVELTFQGTQYMTMFWVLMTAINIRYAGFYNQSLLKKMHRY